MKNRLKQSKKNIAYGLSFKIVIMLLEFISRYYFIQYLGIELLGVNGVFTNIIQFLSIAELGMNNVVMYSYYKPLAEHDETKLASLNSFYRKIYNGIALSVACIGLFFIPFLGYIIKTDYEIPYITLVYLLFLADTVISYVCVYKVAILIADQNAYIGTRYDIILSIIRTVIQILSLILYKNYVLYLCIKILFSILGNFLKVKKVEKEYLFTNRKGILPNKDRKEILHTVKSGFIYKLSAIFLNCTDNILISIIVGTVWVGALSNYVTLCTAVASFVFIIYNNMTASVGNLVATEGKEKRFEVFNIMSVTSNWIALVCFTCMLILCDDFLSIWLGSSFVMDFSVVLPKVMMLYISCVMQPIFSYREALGLYTKTKYVMLLAVIINIVLSVILGIYFGISGILIASLIAVLVTYFWYEPLILHRDCFGVAVKSYYKRIIFNIMLCGIISAILKFFCDCWVVTGWFDFLLKGITVFVITNIVGVIVYCKTKEFEYITKKLFRKKIKIFS